jgi:hypothetical protein
MSPVAGCQKASLQPSTRYSDERLDLRTDQSILAGNWLLLVWEVPFPLGICIPLRTWIKALHSYSSVSRSHYFTYS